MEEIMLKLKDVFALPGTMVPMTEYILTDKWLPELPELEYTLDRSTLLEIDKDAFFGIRKVVEENFDSERSAGIYTIWFKGLPAGIIQASGRGGSEDVKRWITDPQRLFDLVQYLRTKITGSVGCADVHDPETDVYPEEVFGLYGNYYGDGFGYPRVTPAKGFMLLFDNIIPEVDPSLILVTATAEHNPMPEYIRREAYVMKKVSKVTADELARNPRVALFAKEDGYSQIYWYQAAPRPIDCPVIAV